MSDYVLSQEEIDDNWAEFFSDGTPVMPKVSLVKGRTAKDSFREFHNRYDKHGRLSTYGYKTTALEAQGSVAVEWLPYLEKINDPLDFASLLRALQDSK